MTSAAHEPNCDAIQHIFARILVVALVAEVGAARTGCIYTNRCQAIHSQTIIIWSEKQHGFLPRFPPLFLLFCSFFRVTFQRGSRRRSKPDRERRCARVVSEAAVWHANPTPDSAPSASLLSPRFLFTHSPSWSVPVGNSQQIYPRSDAHADMHAPLVLHWLLQMSLHYTQE